MTTPGARRLSHEIDEVTGRPPNLFEVSSKLGIPLQEADRVLKASRTPISLDTPYTETGEGDFGDFLEDKTAPRPTDGVNRELLADRIRRVLGDLPVREREVIIYRFGLSGEKVYTLEQLGKRFNRMGAWVMWSRWTARASTGQSWFCSESVFACLRATGVLDRLYDAGTIPQWFLDMDPGHVTASCIYDVLCNKEFNPDAPALISANQVRDLA